MTSTGQFANAYGLKDQIRRAAFHRFIVIAKGSCSEVRCQLYVALDAGYISLEEAEDLQRLAVEVAKIIAGLRLSVEKQRDKK